MPVNAVFFDLDGTLLDTAPDLSRALNRLLVEFGKPEIPLVEIRKVVSDGAYAMLKLAFNCDRDHPDTPALRTKLLDFYLEDLSSSTTLYPGIAELITTLTEQGIAWGIVTNKPNTYAIPLIERFEFASRPVCLVCPEDVSNRKPHAEPLLLACQHAGCESQSAVYVGDHVRDIQCGINAGASTIAVAYGYIADDDSAHNWQADHVVESGHDLWPIINGYR